MPVFIRPAMVRNSSDFTGSRTSSLLERSNRDPWFVQLRECVHRTGHEHSGILRKTARNWPRQHMVGRRRCLRSPYPCHFPTALQLATFFVDHVRIDASTIYEQWVATILYLYRTHSISEKPTGFKFYRCPQRIQPSRTVPLKTAAAQTDTVDQAAWCQ